MNKKSQVIYFLFAAMLLAGILITAFFVSHYSASKSNINNINKEIVTDQRLKPLSVFVDGCLYDSFVSSIQDIAAKGGSSVLYGTPYRTMPTDASLYHSPIFGNLPILYGFSFSRGLFVNYLDISKIKSEVISEMKPKFLSCIGDFNNFPGLNVKRKGQPVFDLQFKNNSTYIVANYHLEIDFNNGKKSISSFVTTASLNLNRLVDSINQFLSYLSTSHQLSKNINEYFEHFTGISERFPPKFGVYNSFKIYNKNTLKTEFSNIMTALFAKTRVVDTSRFPTMFNANPLYELTPFSKAVPYDVSVYYFGSNPVFKVYPDPESPLIVPKMLSPSILFSSASFKYSNGYVLGVPSTVVFKDDSALGGKGLDFKFAVLPMYCIDSPCGVGTNLSFTKIKQSQDFQSYFCNLAPKSFNVSLKTFGSDGKPIENPTILYHCGKNTCSVNYSSSNDVHTFSLPMCLNASIEVMNSSYSSASINFNSLPGKKMSSVVTLNKIYVINASSMSAKLLREDLVGNFIGLVGHKFDSLRDSASESIPANVTYVVFGQKSDSSNIPSVFVVSNKINKKTKFMLSAGLYNIHEYVVFNKNETIPGCCQGAAFQAGKGNCIGFGQWINKTTMNKTVGGIADFNITLSESQLKNWKSAEFYLYYTKLPKNMCSISDWKIKMNKTLVKAYLPRIQ